MYIFIAVGIYKRKQESKKTRTRPKGDQENKKVRKQENKNSTKKRSRKQVLDPVSD